MSLIESSTPRQRNTAKILFYGQSITKQDWWKLVGADLRRRYPNADLVILNRAIGGFSTQYLKRTLEHDVLPVYPDLVIFHDYGREDQYEAMIELLRSKTTAEIAIQTDHITWMPKPGEEPDPERVKTEAWHDRHNSEWMPQLAARHGLELIDVRSAWRSYLQQNNLRPEALLRDGVHLNEQGDVLMAKIVSESLRPSTGAPAQGTVRDVVVGKDLQWADGRLRLPFDGNRVELLTSTQDRQPYTRARILIDGKPPSSFPELYLFERPSDTIGPDWPLFIRIGSEAPLLAEDWTLKVTESDGAGKSFRFDVRGSVTGPDGSGSSTERFVSESRRVVIEPSDWHAARAYDLSKKPLPVGYEARFRVLPQFTDLYEPPRVDDRTREYPTLAASGLANARHVLELIAETAETPQIGAIRVYRPPLRAAI